MRVVAAAERCQSVADRCQWKGCFLVGSNAGPGTNAGAVAGVPAKPIKERFSRDIQDKLLALAWWDWEHESLAAAMDDFRNLNIYALVEKYG